MSQKTKMTLIEVTEIIEKEGCKLLSTEYINMKTKLDLICNCGIEFSVNLDTFKNKNKKQCNSCSLIKVKASNTNSKLKVATYIESKGCKLLSEYVNAKTKLKIACNCGNVFERNFNKFKSGQIKCNKCIGRTVWNYESVIDYIESSGCKLLSDTFNNRKELLLLKCSCGEEYSTNFHTFLNENKKQCSNCSKIKFRELRRTGISELKKHVESNSDCILISEDYVDYSDKLKFICKCENSFETSMISFNRGKKHCDSCSPKSKLEYNCEKFLINNNIKYKSQVSYDDLLSPKNRHLKFDFAILDENEEVKFLIELDGEQHFKPSNLFGIEKFKTQILYDNLKNEYCDNKNITLHRIPYTKLKDLDNILFELICKNDNPVPSL